MATWKVILEAPGYNRQVLTSEHAKEQGITWIVTLIIGWLCMFNPELFHYVLRRDNEKKA